MAEKKNSFFVTVLVMAFGMSSWLSVNSCWVELPMLVHTQPEGWNLPSFLAVLVQIAAIGPLSYAIMDKLLFLHGHLTLVICIILVFAGLTQLLLAFCWSFTTYLWGVERSTALFVLFFCLSLANTTSNVTFLPFMDRFRRSYVTAYFSGMGFSAFVPSVLALIQGSGRVECRMQNETENSSTTVSSYPVEASFNPTVFFAIIFCTLCVSFGAFLGLNKLRIARFEMVEIPSHDEDEDDPAVADVKAEAHPPQYVTHTLSTSNFMLLLFLTGYVCLLMNGVLPSIQSFSCLPYGQRAYHLSVILSNFANPVACFVPFFVSHSSITLLVMLCILEAVFAGYVIGMAALSPEPLMLHHAGGEVLLIFAWIAVIALAAYLRTVMAEMLRGSGRSRALFWCGVATQLGSFVGAVVIFLLVNVCGLFKAVADCSNHILT